MTSVSRALLALCSLPFCILAQPAGPPYSIVGAAGAPFVLGDGGPATSAILRSPQFIAVDAAGNLYIGESLGYRFWKVTPGGVITTIAGTGASGGSPSLADRRQPRPSTARPGSRSTVTGTSISRNKPSGRFPRAVHWLPWLAMAAIVETEGPHLPPASAASRE